MQTANMQNERTIIDLGFKHHPEWDFKYPLRKNYRLEINGVVFRAFEWGKAQGYSNEKTFISAGVVLNEKGKVDRWRDLCSNDSVLLFIKKSLPPDSPDTPDPL